MKMFIVGIYDKKGECFISLEPSSNLAVATRQLQDVVTRTDGNPIAKWPEDYSLWHLGTYDNETGLVEPLLKGKIFKKQLVIEAASLKPTAN